MSKIPEADGFKDIYEELSWCFFKMNGNPEIMQDMINERYTIKEESLGLGK